MITAEVLEKLKQMSVSTLWRLLPRGEHSRLAYRKSRPGASTALRQAVPVRRIRWNEPEPGHFEVDLVHHCGVSTEGQYVHTLQMVDVATGWSECAAILGRSYLVMQDGFQRILKRLPFPVVEIHPDNGAEFFNALAVGACLVIGDSHSYAAPDALEALLREEEITAAQFTPSMLRSLSPDRLPSLNTIVSAGEPLTRDLAARWSDAMGS